MNLSRLVLMSTMPEVEMDMPRTLSRRISCLSISRPQAAPAAAMMSSTLMSAIPVRVNVSTTSQRKLNREMNR